MPSYLTKFSYTPAAWATLIQSQEDRSQVISQFIESVGGKVQRFFYGFGEHDAYIIWNGPDNVSAAALSVKATAGGALKSIDTTALLTVEETLSALQKASGISYQPPGERTT